jgi:hypothetical protein
MDEIKKLKKQIEILKNRIKELEDQGYGWNQCVVCGHGWKQRKDKKSLRCPRCSRKNWEDGKRKKQSYGIEKLEIGESKIIPWNLLPDGNMDQKKNYRVARAVDSYSCRTKRRFRKEPNYTGLKITRIS